MGPVVLIIGAIAVAVAIGNSIELRNRERREKAYQKTLYNFDAERGAWRPVPPEDER